jgi:hypothetical protein
VGIFVPVSLRFFRSLVSLAVSALFQPSVSAPKNSVLCGRTWLTHIPVHVGDFKGKELLGAGTLIIAGSIPAPRTAGFIPQARGTGRRDELRDDIARRSRASALACTSTSDRRSLSERPHRQIRPIIPPALAIPSRRTAVYPTS